MSAAWRLPSMPPAAGRSGARRTAIRQRHFKPTRSSVGGIQLAVPFQTLRSKSSLGRSLRRVVILLRSSEGNRALSVSRKKLGVGPAPSHLGHPHSKSSLGRSLRGFLASRASPTNPTVGHSAQFTALPVTFQTLLRSSEGKVIGQFGKHLWAALLLVCCSSSEAPQDDTRIS